LKKPRAPSLRDESVHLGKERSAEIDEIGTYRRVVPPEAAVAGQLEACERYASLVGFRIARTFDDTSPSRRRR
jgi:hypothetical protein